jgi:hypothetical protein
MPASVAAVAIAFSSLVFAVEDPVAVVVRKVEAFSAALQSAQHEKFHLDFGDEARVGWSFLPGERKGLPLAELNAAQEALLFDVLRALLSASGFEKIEKIRSLEDVLRALHPNDKSRDKTKYFIALFGAPGAAPWGLRWEGHHISLNWTFAEGKLLSSTPQFLGSNPAEVLEGPLKGTRALGAEEDLARALLALLSEEQRAVCVTSDKAPADILTRMDREAGIQENTGLRFADMTDAQRGMLIELINVYTSVQLPGVAAERVQKIKDAGMDEIRFAWMGGLEKGQGHYYRVQGPTFLIEYDNTQNNANHIHTVWRDFNGDFGRDVLKDHYRAHANPAHPQEHIHN